MKNEKTQFYGLLALVSIALQVATSVHAGEIKMKKIQYRVGLVSFSIPEHWVEEYEPDGGGMFY